MKKIIACLLLIFNTFIMDSAYAVGTCSVSSAVDAAKAKFALPEHASLLSPCGVEMLVTLSSTVQQILPAAGIYASPLITTAMNAAFSSIPACE